MAGTVTQLVIDGVVRHFSGHLFPRVGITVSSMRLMTLVLCVFLHTMTIVRSLHDVPLSVRHHHSL
jgi:hypothetical protein